MTTPTTTGAYDISVMIALVTAFKLANASDAAALRAADNALDHLMTAPVLAFDAAELRVQSQSRSGKGIEHVADAYGCSCEGAKHPWCKHRGEYRLLLASLALTNPAELIRLIVEQMAPAADEVEPAPGPRVSAVIAAAAAELDDVAYLDSIVADADRRSAASAEAEFLELYPPR